MDEQTLQQGSKQNIIKSFSDTFKSFAYTHASSSRVVLEDELLVIVPCCSSAPDVNTLGRSNVPVDGVRVGSKVASIWNNLTIVNQNSF